MTGMISTAKISPTHPTMRRAVEGCSATTGWAESCRIRHQTIADTGTATTAGQIRRSNPSPCMPKMPRMRISAPALFVARRAHASRGLRIGQTAIASNPINTQAGIAMNTAATMLAINQSETPSGNGER